MGWGMGDGDAMAAKASHQIAITIEVPMTLGHLDHVRDRLGDVTFWKCFETLSRFASSSLMTKYS